MLVSGRVFRTTLKYLLAVVNTQWQRYLHTIMKNDKLLTIEQAADLLGMRPVTVRLWAATHRIGRVKLSRAVRIPESEVNRLIERNLIPALPERER
jgi:excisionase family DNA binding protein